MERELFLGCDVSKETFHYCLRNRSVVLVQGDVENTTKAIRSWIAQLTRVQQVSLDQIVFCMEHTGIYSAILCRELYGYEAMICLEGAVQIKQSLGLQRGKNDKVDAARIAEYAMRFTDRLRQWKPKRKVVDQLDVLCSARGRLVKVRKALTTPTEEVKRFLDKDSAALTIQSTKHAVQGIEKDLENIERQIKSLLQSDENLKRLTRLVTSVDGVGIVTCCELIVRTNEFTAFSNAKKIACTAGVAPYEHTSGTSIRGKTRVSHKAHKEMKTLLHLCALACISKEGPLRTYYVRKVAEGKPKMLVINAIRNKLLLRIFAVVRDNTMYQKNYQYRLA